MYYIGFDIGGTKCAVSLAKYINNTIEIIERQETQTKTSPNATIDVFVPFVTTWKEKYNVTKSGISCGGPLDASKGIIISTPNLSKDWHGFEIVSYIKSRFGLSAKLENDANASAVAEWKFGAGSGTKNMIFMTFGTGLGAGLIIDGKLYSGTNGNAGEIGHIRLDKDGPIGYNKAGSAEGFCSGNGIKRLAQIRAEEQGVLIDNYITTKTIFEKAKQGDKFYLSVITECAEKFAYVVSMLIDLFNPEVIVAGGVFMRNYDFFMSIITPILEKECLPDSYKVCKILPAKIGENIGDYAALAIAVLEN
ncbi:MAG: ROK family protein [Clostridia bacterium]|nr:ROK family protein [Clostridia bacterium]